ncbi:MAG: helix-turn-helix domain-containing protein [Xenococcaceae cyanobacterium MO_234.B1]|nr:helix-turn-helix domain-containing protein [Xenococcaceae cyanobacterium MO_234.B1]
MKSQYFQDFDEFANSVRDVDSTMMLQNPVRLIWSMNHVYLPEIHMQLGQLGSGNIVEGQSWSNGYVLYLPLTATCEYSANGKVVDKDSFLILEPGCDFCISTKTEHDWCSIFVPTHNLARGSELVESSSGWEKMTCRVTRPNLQLVDQFQSLVDMVMTAATNYCEFESSPAARGVEAELLKVASLILGQRQGGKPHPERRPRLSREEIIRRSKELLEERDGKPVLVGELAARVEVSERTLRTAFNEYFGVGPARYLQLRQLHQVHRVLRAAEPGAVSVSDILFQHGVWQLSRFGSQYRRLFGELPSETLRTKRGSSLR